MVMSFQQTLSAPPKASKLEAEQVTEREVADQKMLRASTGAVRLAARCAHGKEAIWNAHILCQRVWVWVQPPAEASPGRQRGPPGAWTPATLMGFSFNQPCLLCAIW